MILSHHLDLSSKRASAPLQLKGSSCSCCCVEALAGSQTVPLRDAAHGTRAVSELDPWPITSSPPQGLESIGIASTSTGFLRPNPIAHRSSLLSLSILLTNVTVGLLTLLVGVGLVTACSCEQVFLTWQQHDDVRGIVRSRFLFP
jgi:hypothetical protein